MRSRSAYRRCRSARGRVRRGRGRSASAAALDKSSSRSARSQTRGPVRRSSDKLPRSMTVPPPAAMTCPPSRQIRRTASASRRRKPLSPSAAKMSGIDMPARASMTASTSTNGRDKRAASRCPTVVLPAPMKPMSVTLSSIRTRGSTRTGGFLRRKDGQRRLTAGPFAAAASRAHPAGPGGPAPAALCAPAGASCGWRPVLWRSED